MARGGRRSAAVVSTSMGVDGGVAWAWLAIDGGQTACDGGSTKCLSRRSTTVGLAVGWVGGGMSLAAAMVVWWLRLGHHRPPTTAVAATEPSAATTTVAIVAAPVPPSSSSSFAEERRTVGTINIATHYRRHHHCCPLPPPSEAITSESRSTRLRFSSVASRSRSRRLRLPMIGADLQAAPTGWAAADIGVAWATTGRGDNVGSGGDVAGGVGDGEELVKCSRQWLKAAVAMDVGR
ncbi:hypothetical protein Dimus_026828 [Dionaea muscipula]